MGNISSLSVLFALVFSLLVSCGVEAAIVQPTSATAVFNLDGVTGWVRFFQNDPLADILLNLHGLTQDADWSIHELPVDETLSLDDRCSEAYLGGVYNPTNATVVANPDCSANPCPVGDLSGRLRLINQLGVDWFNETNTNRFTLQGPQSIIGRSLLLEIGSKRVCSTIRSKAGGVITILQATFISPVAGTIYFRQSGIEPTVIHGKLFWTNDTDTTSAVEWTIYDDLLNETYRAGECGIPNIMSPGGDLSGTHSTITISSSPLPYSENAFLFTNDALKLSEGIDGRSLYLHQGGSIIGCAPIVISESIETFQYPDFDVHIHQSSPYENSTLEQSQFFRNSTYTILSAAWMTNGLCPLTDQVYNPLDITAPGSDVVFRTPDMFEYGNISGKFGSELGPSQTLRFPELPMYGTFSMLGLTLRAVSRNPANPYRICSALVPLKDENTLLAKATFTEGSVRGAVYFLQRQDPEFSGQPGVTNIIVDLYLSDRTTVEASAWQIQATTSTCSVGISYNPFGVTGGADYAAECTINSPLRCENGDLIGKHGELTIGPLGASRNTYAFIDPNLQLDQMYKIVGQSLALYSSSLVGCAEIKIVKPSDPQYDVFVAFPEASNFERVAFTKKLVEMASLGDKLDPTDLLILHEEVGTIVSDATCAMAQLKITASSVEEANSYATLLQRSVCDQFVDDGCMTRLPNYNTVCGGAQAVVAALSIILLATTLAVVQLL